MSSALIPAAETGEFGKMQCTGLWAGLAQLRDAQVRDQAVGAGEVAEHWEKHAQSWMSSALNPALEVDQCKKWEMCCVRSLLNLAEGKVGCGVKIVRP